MQRVVALVLPAALLLQQPACAQADAARGRAVVASRQQGLCLLCHSAPIPEERLQGNLAPNLADAVQGKTEAELRQILHDPSRFRPDTIMPAYGRIDHLHRVPSSLQGQALLEPRQIDDVVAYLMTLQKP